MTGTVVAAAAEDEDALAFFARRTKRCAEYASATESSSAYHRLTLMLLETLVDTSRRETRSERMGVGARKARSETRKAARRMRGDREWYRWFMTVDGLRARTVDMTDEAERNGRPATRAVAAENENLERGEVGREEPEA